MHSSSKISSLESRPPATDVSDDASVGHQDPNTEPAGRTWQNVKKAISGDLYVNPTWRGLAYLFRDLVFLGACFSGLYILDEWYYLLPLWSLSGLILGGLFGLGHDLAHGSLFQNKRLTYWTGLISFIPTLVPFRQFVHGHNRHHGHTVEIDGDFVWHPTSPAEYRSMSRARRALHRIYWSAAGAGLYYLVEIWLGDLILKKAANRGAGIDRWMVVGFMLLVSAGLFYFGGLWAWTKVFFIPFILWNYFAGITLYLQHIHPRVLWKTPEQWTAMDAQVFGTINYHVPAVVNFFIHNVYLHMPHHVQIRIPFYNLPQALEQIRAYSSDLILESNRPVRDYLQITRKCKLFDPESGRWYTYREAPRVLPE